MMNDLITLPHDNNRQFDARLLAGFMMFNGMAHIIQGQQQVIISEHSKPNSLDFFIRHHFAGLKDTAQAVNDVMEQLVRTGYFVEHEALLCPDSGRLCKGLILLRK